MKKVKIALVGAGGYGNYCLMLLQDYVDSTMFELVGVIDPYVKLAPKYQWLCDNNIKLFNTLEEFYLELEAELVIIATPLIFHKEQVLTALNNNSNVLCEKPLVSIIQEVEEIKIAIESSKKLMGVGFQWSFSPTMLELKKDILNGVLGKPLSLKTFISWKRYDSYYKKGWTGKAKDSKGNWILDSVTTNATSHYLHNIFFVLGNKIDTAKLPKHFKASLYKAKEIETFDTCFIKGEFDDGCEFFYCASHSAELDDEPKFIYEFENATVKFNIEDKMSQVAAEFKDGSKKVYGYPQCEQEVCQKLITMINATRNVTKIPCTIDTVIPHLKVTNSLFEYINVTRFEGDKVYRETEKAGTFVKGLHKDMLDCFNQSKLPTELGFDWAVEEVDIIPDNMNCFAGNKYMR